MTLTDPQSTDPAGAEGRLSSAVRRHPRRWVLSTLVVALLVGAGIGGASGSDQATVDRLDGQLSNTRGELRDARAQLDAASGELDVASAKADDLRSELEDAKATIKRLTAKGEVLDFTGGTVEDAKEAASDFDWNFKTVSQATADAEPGTVIAQEPSEGTMLRRGRSVTLTIAKEVPPSWKSVFSFSGSGSRKSDEFTIPRGAKTRIAYSFSGDTNAILELGVPGDEYGGELLLNEIGDYSDVTRVYNHSGRRFLSVEGGSWTVDVQVFK